MPAVKSNTKKTGRPEINIDASEVEKLAGIGCTNVEIAEFFGCSEGTIRGRFCENLKKGRAGLKKRLRKKQIEIALGGNVSMLIWLGKQYLGQKEKAELSGSAEEPIRMVEYVKNYKVPTDPENGNGEDSCEVSQGSVVGDGQ